MQTKIEKIGDGFGLLLPKELLDACGIGQEATLTVEDKTLILLETGLKSSRIIGTK